MKPIPILLATAGVLACAATAQDALYYKFDETGGKKAVNFAYVGALGPNEGTIVTTDTTAFAPGRFGAGALRGGPGASTYSYVDTGYYPAFTGSFTCALFLKQRAGPPTTTEYFFCAGTGPFRLLTGTGSVAGNGVWCRAWGGSPADLTTSYDLVTAASTAWVHLALVVDATALTATYYINGYPQTTIPITSGANIAASSAPFLVHSYSTPSSYPGYYDIDEFRFSQRAATATEIARWATRTSPIDEPYGKGCHGATLASSGGKPQLGNAAYTFNLQGTAGGYYGLGIGLSRLYLGALPLPLDLGQLWPSLPGCYWECSGEVFVAGTLTGGYAAIPFPIPNNLSLDAAALWNQAIVFAGSTPSQTTNGWAVSIGQ